MSSQNQMLLMEAYRNVYEAPEYDTEAYESIVDFLVSEGLVESLEEADEIISEMSDDEILDVLDEASRPGQTIRGIERAGHQNISNRRLSASGSPFRSEKAMKKMEKTAKIAGDAQAHYYRNVGSRRAKNESYDNYDLILSHLLDEGYADSEENAVKIMSNMSEEWVEDILEAKMESGKSEAEKKDIRGRRYAQSIGRGDDYDKMGPTAPNWVAAQRRRNNKAMRGVKN